MITGQYRASWDVRMITSGGQVTAEVFTDAPQARRLARIPADRARVRPGSGGRSFAMTAPRLPVTRALAVRIADATGRPCGIGELPFVQGEYGGWEPAAAPYTVLDSLPGEFSWSPLADWSAVVTAAGPTTCMSPKAT
ncbi:hypothetical protein [Streptomyces sp. NPDC048665]|uniref:hypothetical protein n=1 Tax=Streptomyces sp. NPDC048665 TaxID=3155490 RepID=UPI00343A2D9C